MGEHKRLLLLILIMTTVSLAVVGITIYVLYDTAFEEERERLVETARSQARLIEAVARFDASHEMIDPGSYPEGPATATLSQIIDANAHYQGFGDTGEFTLARRAGDHILFLLRHRHSDLDQPKKIPFTSKLAEPMRRALSGQSGTVVGFDYRGEVVLGAYEPVSELNMGIVAKIDLAEVRAPFVKASIIALCAALLVVFFGALLFFRISNPMIKRAEAELRKAHDILETRVKERTAELVEAYEQLKKSEEELRHLSSQLLRVQEQERGRIARELHDGIGQSLSAIKFKLENVFGQMVRDSEESRDTWLDDLVLAIQRTMDEVRRITMDLRPSTLDDLGILATISWFCREYQKIYSSIKIDREINIEESEVIDSLKIIIFRILQEALSNVAKHSQADRAKLSLTSEAKIIELAIEDNGRGFDLQKAFSVAGSERGFGLSSMRERTELSGGSFSIESVCGTGTVVRASWPLHGP